MNFQEYVSFLYLKIFRDVSDTKTIIHCILKEFWPEKHKTIITSKNSDLFDGFYESYTTTYRCSCQYGLSSSWVITGLKTPVIKNKISLLTCTIEQEIDVVK